MALDPFDRRGGHERDGQPALRGEALLEREVVDVGGRRSTGSPPAPDVASTSTSASSVRTGSCMTPVEVSLWVNAWTSTPSGAADACGRVPGSAATTSGSSSQGAAAVAFGELRGELAEGVVAGAALDQAERGRLPEGGRAAEGEQHLVAVGEAEQAGQALLQPLHLDA